MLMALIQAACSLVPRYARPDPPVPQAWNATPDRSLPDAVVVRTSWWRSFGSSEFSRLAEKSLTGNYNLQAAVARIQEAHGSAQIAGAPLFPVLSLNGTLVRSNGQGTDLKTSRFQNLFGLATYEVDFWGRSNVAAQSLNDLTIPKVKANMPSLVLRQRPDITAAEAHLVAANFNVGQGLKWPQSHESCIALQTGCDYRQSGSVAAAAVAREWSPHRP